MRASTLQWDTSRAGSILLGMAGLTPQEFVYRWRGVALKERSASQSHFIDLCRLLDQPTPTEADPTGEFYTFERGAEKSAGPMGSGHGWADVFAKALASGP